MNATLNHAPNLTQRPPRSPRVRLGGYVVLARILFPSTRRSYVAT
jgi:hypothetical protein